jgi:hypothetical protein
MKLFYLHVISFKLISISNQTQLFTRYPALEVSLKKLSDSVLKVLLNSTISLLIS